MKSYKEFDKEYLGGSDIATLILVGFDENSSDWLKTMPLHFGGDGGYDAYIVNGNCEIGNHYTKVATFNAWLKVYDDFEKTKTYYADEINVYRGGGYGCIIQLINRETESED